MLEGGGGIQAKIPHDQPGYVASQSSMSFTGLICRDT